MKAPAAFAAATLTALLSAVGLAGCASLGGPPLQPGISTRLDLDRYFGPPAARWREAEGGERLAYPTGPMGFNTWMNGSSALCSSGLMPITKPSGMATSAASR